MPGKQFAALHHAELDGRAGSLKFVQSCTPDTRYGSRTRSNLQSRVLVAHSLILGRGDGQREACLQRS